MIVNSRIPNAAVLVAATLVSSLLSANLLANTFVFWDVTTGATEGTADGVTVTAAYGVPINNTSSGNMSGSDFDPPGSSSQQYVDVDQDSSIAWTFDQPVEDLLLYLYFWRGAGASAGGPPNGLYTFDQAPAIQSGLADATISGNSLIVTSSNVFYSGILSFPGPLTSLSLLTPQTGGSGGNGYTMSFSAVPEPSAIALLASTACGAAFVARKNLSRRRRSGAGFADEQRA